MPHPTRPTRPVRGGPSNFSNIKAPTEWADKITAMPEQSNYAQRQQYAPPWQAPGAASMPAPGAFPTLPSQASDRARTAFTDTNSVALPTPGQMPGSMPDQIPDRARNALLGIRATLGRR